MTAAHGRSCMNIKYAASTFIFNSERKILCNSRRKESQTQERMNCTGYAMYYYMYALTHPLIVLLSKRSAIKIRILLWNLESIKSDFREVYLVDRASEFTFVVFTNFSVGANAEIMSILGLQIHNFFSRKYFILRSFYVGVIIKCV